MEELEEAVQTAKMLKKNAEDRLEDIRRRIALNGYYLYYAWVNGKFQLCDGNKIPKWDRGELWSQEGKNVEAMKSLFGYDFPAPPKPIEAERDENDEECDND